jgi:hypothetical protein
MQKFFHEISFNIVKIRNLAQLQQHINTCLCRVFAGNMSSLILQPRIFWIRKWRKNCHSYYSSVSSAFMIWFMMILHQEQRLCTTNTACVWVLCQCEQPYASKWKWSQRCMKYEWYIIFPQCMHIPT